MSKHIHVYGDVEVAEVRELHERFNFPRADTPTHQSLELMSQRYVMMQEELDEFMTAAVEGDIVEMADALVDLVYFAKGTAVMMGLPWGEIWNAVHAANMAKVPGKNDKRPDQSYDLIKPEGWTPPDVATILKERS